MDLDFIFKKNFWSLPFRPFFFAAALSAFFLPTLWISLYFGHVEYRGVLDTLTWHAHEMLFGFVGALLAGFLLTASSHWSGNRPFQNQSLGLLLFFWFIERIIFYFSTQEAILLLGGLPFWSCFIFYLWKMFKGYPRGKKVFIPLLILFFLMKEIFIYTSLRENIGFQNYSKFSSIALVRFFLLLVGTRIIPFFTQKRFPHLELAINERRKKVFLLTLFLLIFFNLNQWDGVLPLLITILSLISGIFYWISLRPDKVVSEPMLGILHLGFVWIFIHFVLEIGNVLFLWGQMQTHILHALTVGALGCFSLGMMTRVTMGHTGREIIANKGTWLIFICVNLGAFIRVFTPIFEADFYLESLHYASGLWTLGFLLFLVFYGPYLFKSRRDI